MIIMNNNSNIINNNLFFRTIKHNAKIYVC